MKIRPSILCDAANSVTHLRYYVLRQTLSHTIMTTVLRIIYFFLSFTRTPSLISIFFFAKYPLFGRYDRRFSDRIDRNFRELSSNGIAASKSYKPKTRHVVFSPSNRCFWFYVVTSRHRNALLLPGGVRDCSTPFGNDTLYKKCVLQCRIFRVSMYGRPDRRCSCDIIR